MPRRHPHLWFVIVIVLAAILASNAPVARAQPPSDFVGVEYNGQRFFAHGANLPWLRWGCDFGSGCTWGSVGVREAETQQQLRKLLTEARASGLTVIRWWLFLGEPTTNDQGNTMLQVDSQGKPTGIHPGVFTDLDAALNVAEETGVRYNFTLFSSHMDVPDSWLANPAHRQALADVLGQLFARYATSERIFAWELFNEPEWGLGNTADPANSYALNVKDLTRRVIAAQRAAGTTALVNLGPAWITFDFWRDLDVDVFSPHYYSNMTEPWRNALGTTAAELRRQHRISQPILLGELYVGSGQPPPQQYEPRAIDPLARYEEVLRRGYAGAWGWTLNEQATSDKLTLDRDAAAQFSRRYPELSGPREPDGQPPRPTATRPAQTQVPLPTASPVRPTATVAPVRPTATAVPVRPTATAAPVRPTATAAPVRSTATAAPVPPGGLRSLLLFDDRFEAGWSERWSWGVTVQPAVASPRQSGASSLGVAYTRGWGGLRLMPSQQRADWRGYRALRFALHGGTSGGQTLKVAAHTPTRGFTLGVVTAEAGRWTTVELPLPSDPALSAVSELVFQQHTGRAEPTLFLDRIELVADVAGVPSPPVSEAGSKLLYDDAFASSWGERWSWGVTVQPAVASPRQSGALSLGVTYTADWGGLRLMPSAPHDDWRGYGTLRFAVHGGTTGGQTVKVWLNTPTGSRELGLVRPRANQWTEVALPLPDDPALSAVAELVFQQHTGRSEPTLYLDRIQLLAR